MTTNNSISNTDLEKFIADHLAEIRTTSVTFSNNTSYWEVGWWVYECRQTQNLPAPTGFADYTGIVVGGTDTAPGQEQTAFLTVKLIANFTDCGLVNLHNRATGQRLPTHNFPDRNAPAGKYYSQARYGIKDGQGANDGIIMWDFEGILSDGTVVKDEGLLTTVK